MTTRKTKLLSKTDRTSYLENPTIYAIGQERPHVQLMPVEDISSLTQPRETSAFYHSLNGQWHFYWSYSPKEHPSDFHKNDFVLKDYCSIKIIVIKWEC